MGFKKLFTPIKIRDLELPNRIVMSAAGTSFSKPSEDGRYVTDKLIQYHVARAKGGVGMQFTECCSVDYASSPAGFLAISHDKYLPDLKRLCDAVHAAGGRIGVQLWQGASCVASDPKAEILVPDGFTISADIFPGVDEDYYVAPVSKERLERVLDSYAQATRRAVEAGFDIIELHAGHNYLMHQMLSGGFNHRTDEYGGSFENRLRFPLKVVEAIRSNMPDGMPLSMRVSWKDDDLEDGLTPEQVIEFCKRAGELGVDLLNVSRGNVVNWATYFETPPTDLPNGFNVEAAARIRKETGMLVMPCGRINKPELAEQILENDQADLVVMLRAQMADPEFCNKVKAGKLSSIKYCNGCDQGCYGTFVKCLVDPNYEHITCVRNPALGEEATLSLTQAPVAKKVLVAGGGMAGIEAADALYKKGHKPILCEAGNHLGGQYLLAGMSPRKDDFAFVTRMAAQNILDEGVPVRLNTPVTPDLIEAEMPEAVIIAIGSSPFTPPIPGVDNKMVYGSHDVLAGVEIPTGKVVVIGGGLVGIEVSEFLAARGNSVTIVELKDSILGELNLMRQVGTQLAMEQEDITVMLKTSCLEIKDGQVLVETEGKQHVLDADYVVMAVGTKSNPSDDLQAVCEKNGIPYYVVGDAVAPRMALEAISEAYHAVLKI